MFKHPSYYKKLRSSQVKKSDQAISFESGRHQMSVRLVRAPSNKLQAASVKLQAPSSSKKEPQASSVKHKGSSFKPQASSALIPDPGKSFTDL